MQLQVSDSKIKRAIGLLGDTHFGSIYSPMNEIKTQDGRMMIPSFEQMHLNQIFKWCSQVMDYWKVDTLIFLGDLIQGSNRKTLGRDTIFTDLEEQQRLAIDYLKPICKNRKIYGVSGTVYHQSIDTDAEKDIIEALGGTFFQKMAWIKIKDSRRILNVSHESAKSHVLPVSSCEREAKEFFKGYGEGKLPHKPDVIIRGHRHVFAHIHTSSYHFVLIPSFQVWYPFQTAYYGALQSDLGIAILFLDEKDRVIVHHYTSDTRPRVGDKTYDI